MRGGAHPLTCHQDVHQRQGELENCDIPNSHCRFDIFLQGVAGVYHPRHHHRKRGIRFLFTKPVK